MASLHKVNAIERASEANCYVCQSRLAGVRRRSRGAFMPLPVCAVILSVLTLTVGLALAL